IPGPPRPRAGNRGQGWDVVARCFRGLVCDREDVGNRLPRRTGPLRRSVGRVVPPNALCNAIYAARPRPRVHRGAFALSVAARAARRRTCVDISLPLMLPGLANAFLISFIESLADFGNPLVLGGNFNVLSTEIFFSVIGAQLDQGRAATLGIVLLGFALGAF